MLDLAAMLSEVEFRPATPEERERIYRMRHRVYATELRQHPENAAGILTDDLDRFNVYLVAARGAEVVGFVSVTPPGGGKYSIDKYIPREACPFSFDDGLHEIRILTVSDPYRHGFVPSLLMFAALRWIQWRGGSRIVAIGRSDLLGIYEKVGLESLGRTMRSGAVEYELLSAPTAQVFSEVMRRYETILHRAERMLRWKMEFPFFPGAHCRHGGESFEALGVRFDALHRRDTVINADVLDAWFPPAPAVIDALARDLPWLVRSSPPSRAEGMVRAVAEATGVPEESVVPGAGSSDLIYRAFTHWLEPGSRVLLTDPMYGEYAHLCGGILGCRVDTLSLDRAGGFRLDPGILVERLERGYDLAVLVNPNNPTGSHLPGMELAAALESAPDSTRIWVDETYVDYAGTGQSLERSAAASGNRFVCRSLSKVLALSGLRAAYLVGPPDEAAELRRRTPPWCVSLPAQVAAVRALADRPYYEARYRETADLRRALADGLRGIEGLEVLEGCANSILCFLEPGMVSAPALAAACRKRDLYVRDLTGLSSAFADRAFRVAVKEARTNGRMLGILEAALAGPRARASSATPRSGRCDSSRSRP